MTAQKAIEICKEMQKWRRGEEEYSEPNTMPYTPTEFGEAIDELINIAEIYTE